MSKQKMKSTTVLKAFLLLSLIFILGLISVYAQNVEPDTTAASGGIELTLLNWIDLITVVITFISGFAFGTWSKVLNFIAMLIPSLRDWVDAREQKILERTIIDRAERFKKSDKRIGFRVQYQEKPGESYKSLL